MTPSDRPPFGAGRTRVVSAPHASENLAEPLLRMLAQQQTRSEAEWFWEMLWEALGVPGMDRPAKQPATPAKWKILYRDVWLWKAHRASGLSVEDFSARWELFVSSRGEFRFWRDDEHPPEGTPPLQTALFYATKLNQANKEDGSRTLCLPWLRKILKK